MNREDIIRMAREADIKFKTDVFRSDFCDGVYEDDFERFAALVASAEREACAGLRKEVELQGKHSADYEEGFWDALEKYESLIKARGQA